MREEETERAWWAVVWGAVNWASLMLEMEEERFMAEAGWGIAEL